MSATLATTTSRVLLPALSPEDVTDRLAAIEDTYARPETAGVCIVDGFGCRVVVERGALQVHDGIGEHRRTAVTTEPRMGSPASSS